MNLFKSLEREEVTYWVGLALLFVGLTIRVSVATALIVTGAIIALESVVASYLATWLAFKNEPRK
jgi:hypothetical protein